MEENTTPNGPVAKPTVGDMQASPQGQYSTGNQHYATPATQPTVGDGSDVASRRKLPRFLKYIFIAVAAIPAVIVLLVVGYIVVFAVSGEIKMARLHHSADKKLEKLEQILALDQKPKDAKAIVDGDMLTASDDPSRSTSAYLSFENKSTLREIEAKLAAAMELEGFKRDGGNASPYYKFTSPAYAGYPLDDANRIVMRYSNGQDAIKVTYELDKYYVCPKQYTCGRTEKTKSLEKVYDVFSFAATTVIKVSVNYGSAGYYMTQL